MKELQKAHYQRNRKKVIQTNYEYAKKRKQHDPEYRLAMALRQRLYQALKRNYKAGSAVRDLGCSISDFRKHIESQFSPGMSWTNYGSAWHLDHILPLSNYQLSDRGTLRRLVHYTNLQPLWAEDNIRKANHE